VTLWSKNVAIPAIPRLIRRAENVYTLLIVVVVAGRLGSHDVLKSAIHMGHLPRTADEPAATIFSTMDIIQRLHGNPAREHRGTADVRPRADDRCVLGHDRGRSAWITRTGAP
jgi:hypothetical protein